MSNNNDRIDKLKELLGDKFNDDILEKLKNAKDENELRAMLDEYSVELTDEQLDAASGGLDWAYIICTYDS